MIASTPVAVKWLVKVKGCRPITPSGSRPRKLASRMNMNSEKTYGIYFLPPSPTFASSRLLMKVVKYSTAACQRPGTSSRFMPTETNTVSTAAAATMYSALFVKATLNPPSAH